MSVKPFFVATFYLLASLVGLAIRLLPGSWGDQLMRWIKSGLFRRD